MDDKERIALSLFTLRLGIFTVMAAWPMLAACSTRYLLRDLDTHTATLIR